MEKSQLPFHLHDISNNVFLNESQLKKYREACLPSFSHTSNTFQCILCLSANKKKKRIGKIMARYTRAQCGYAGGYRYIFGISPRPTSPKEFNLFFLSFAQPSAVYNRVCKSSHGGRVKQSYRNRCLLSRSADFLYSIDGNPLAKRLP